MERDVPQTEHVGAVHWKSCIPFKLSLRGSSLRGPDPIGGVRLVG